VSNNRAFIPNRARPWIDVRRRWNLSHLHIQMARALEMNPDKFGKLANHRQELWKLPLPDFIEQPYLKRFGKYQARLYVWHGPLALCFRAKSH
jgi:hypothetical protein